MMAVDIAASLVPRAQRLGLVDPATGYVDADELTEYVQGATRYLAHRYQLQHFLALNRELFRTVSGGESYTLPDQYGFVVPIDDRRSGITLADSDGTNVVNLSYYEPARYELLRSTTTSRPAWFTMAEGMIYLMPIPDAVYLVQAVQRPVQETQEVPEPYVAIVEAETLWRLASDLGKATQTLADERQQLTMKTVNDEARFRQKFFVSRERPGLGIGTRARRYGL